MKTLFFKAIFALISMVVASQAFAQCGGMNLKFLGSDGSFHCSPEEARASDRARANLYGLNNNAAVLVQRAPTYLQQPLIVHTMPQGYGYRDCTAGEVIQRDLLMAGRGFVAGLLIGDNSRAAGVGAGVGLLFSMTGSCQVAVPVAIQASQTSLVNQGGTVTTAVQCQPGTSRRMLDWPGHPQHGKFACLPPDEVIAQQKAAAISP